MSTPAETSSPPSAPEPSGAPRIGPHARHSAAPDTADSADLLGVSADPAAHPRAFGSDNWAGVHPEVLAALASANVGHAPSYGADPWTQRLDELMREIFGETAETFPMLNGTGTNVLALQAALPRWGAVICADTAHVNTDETGAPEKTGGIKLLPVPTPDGKLTPALVDREAWGWGNPHRAEPRAVTISQTTEWGTCYTPDEIRALADHAHERGMILHLDGSRLGNAAAQLGTSLAALTSEVGVDIVSLGGTKNGLLGAEALLVLNPAAVAGIPHLRKINLQLASKMRFVSAQLLALYGGDLWLRSARHANAMADRLHAGLTDLVANGRAPGIALVQKRESNAVFVELPREVAAHARTRFAFGDWPGGNGIARLMCAFDTLPEDVDALLATIEEAATRA